ncbi:uncharacterized protein PpBr36_09907 [Pyricularia pennisetigena]|uniref:uncharacterized protein n=1 Tax=Pyricularia pennisetigena TaxID=1578925 RepID=UPI0011535D1A|nr:uncharacterized protein PpBr36_09907 [Pyricularia pennisetigena]TLS22470.1 hypothetical protein PpBr36_09907 [Pyricularia pennisetigena]
MRPLKLLKTLAIAASIIPSAVAAPAGGTSLNTANTATPAEDTEARLHAAARKMFLRILNDPNLENEQFKFDAIDEIPNYLVDVHLESTKPKLERPWDDNKLQSLRDREDKGANGGRLQAAARTKGHQIIHSRSLEDYKIEYKTIDEIPEYLKNVEFNKATPEALRPMFDSWLLWEQNKKLLDEIQRKDNSIQAMALTIENLEARFARKLRSTTLKRLKLKATETMRKFENMSKQHATLKMQLEDLSGTLQGLSSQSEGGSSPDNSPRSSAAGPSHILILYVPWRLLETLHHIKTAVVVPGVVKVQELPKGNLSTLPQHGGGPVLMGRIEEQPVFAPDVENPTGEIHGTDSATLSLPSDSEIPCEPKLAP